jgi:hypothetical protein
MSRRDLALRKVLLQRRVANQPSVGPVGSGAAFRSLLVGWSEIPLFEQVEAVNGARDSSRRELQSVHERNR